MKVVLYSLFTIIRNDVGTKCNHRLKRPTYDRMSVLSLRLATARKTWPHYLADKDNYCLRRVGITEVF